MRKSTNTGFLIDDVGLLKFARCVERFCQNSKLTVLLYHNEKGLTLHEISRAINIKDDELQRILIALIDDETIEEDRIRGLYMLSELGFSIFNLYDNDATITLESRVTALNDKLKIYQRAKENHDEDNRTSTGQEIVSYLYTTYRKTSKELDGILVKVEKEYMNQRNLRLKADVLDIYIERLKNIMFILDVQKREITQDGRHIINVNLKQLLDSDMDFGRDYRPEVESFFKNCNSRLYDKILAIINLFREWWGKTTAALQESDIAAKALDALVNWNEANTKLRNFIYLPESPLPPLHRKFGRSEDADSVPPIGINPNIFRLEDITIEDYELISSRCAALNYDFSTGEIVTAKKAPEKLVSGEIEEEESYWYDKEEEIRAFTGYQGTMLEFLRKRYPDISEEDLLSLYFEIILETGDIPLIFNPNYESDIKDECVGENFKVISVRNRAHE